jgi:hypothetical protein
MLNNPAVDKLFCFFRLKFQTFVFCGLQVELEFVEFLQFGQCIKNDFVKLPAVVFGEVGW